MAIIRPLAPEKLRASRASDRIPFATSDDIPKNGSRFFPQKRALEALDLGLLIDAHGYNIYLAGGANLGRSFLLKEYLAPKAKKEPTPPDLLFVHNFDDPDSPVLLELPAGQGRKLKAALNKVLSQIRNEIAIRIDRVSYTRRRNSIFDKYQKQREQLFKQMNKMAVTQGFTLDLDDAGSMTLYPLVNGKRLNEEEYDKLESDVRSDLKIKGDSLLQPITGVLRKLAKAEQDYIEEERNLEKELIADVLDMVLTPLAEKFVALAPSQKLEKFFADLRNETLENIDALMPSEGGQPLSNIPKIPSLPGLDSTGGDYLSQHYDVNVFVDNGDTQGAPIIFNDHPTHAHLMGSIEREAEMGALITNFTLIKAGAIHKANGGFLVLHMDDLLQYPSAWEALLRSIRSGFARIEDASEEEVTKTKGLQPEPMPLQLKIILVGSEDIYELLLAGDPRFGKLFKIKAHLTEYMARNSAGIRFYLSQIKRIITAEQLLPFDKEAMAGIVDYGSRLIEDQFKLSLEFPFVREIMVEANAFAKVDKSLCVMEKHLQQALTARTFRSNLVEETFLEEYDKKIIKVTTSGKAVGKVNGLAVALYGDFEFGLPHQISCTIGVGDSGIIDLEREAELSGPIHTKAMMILKSYLLRAFGHNKPLLINGSLGFEQNYTGIEGDSASGAELAALLSSLANVPNSLALAFTGAVSQSGQIMAVGGVTCKVEGYFKVCKRHGLTGDQGVILPKDNIAHLMLESDVVEAVSVGKFHIYAVEHITEAMELLTGIPCGRLRKDGTYTRNSLYALVDQRVKELARLAGHHHKR